MDSPQRLRRARQVHHRSLGLLAPILRSGAGAGASGVPDVRLLGEHLLEVRAANHPFTAYGTETASPDYTLVNAGINGNIMSGNRTLFSLYLLANNMGDVAYQNHLSRLKYTDVNLLTGRQGVFNMGRNFMVKLNVPLIADLGFGPNWRDL